MVAKRLLVELLFAAAAGQQPAAKARRTGPAHCQDAQSTAISTPQGAADSRHGSMAPPPMPPTALQTAALRRSNPWLPQLQKKVAHAEELLMHWWKVVQREKMQLQAHLDGNRRTRELQLPPVVNKQGLVVGHYDPEPDIDRLFIKVWSRDMLESQYICFLDLKVEDTIATIKRKVTEHPDVWQTFDDDMTVFYNGTELIDTDTIEERFIYDDCILHAVHYDIGGVARKQSTGLTHWRLLPATTCSCRRPPKVDQEVHKPG